MIPESPGFFLAAGPREKGYNISIMKLSDRIRQHPVAAVILLYAIYTSLFFLIEQLNLPARWTIVCPLDELIPFVPQAVIPYCLWHIELAVFLLAFLRYQPREEFLRAALTMWAGMMHSFRTNGRITIVNGWHDVPVLEKPPKPKKNAKPEEEEEGPLPSLREGDTREVKNTQIREDQTKPPAPHTDASLLAAMETAGKDLEDEELVRLMKGSGIGTPATRAAIIERLIKVGYAARRGKTLNATDKGVMLIDVMPQEIASPETTGRWELALHEITDGKQDPDRFMDGIRKMSAFLVQYAREQAKPLAFPPDERRKKYGAKGGFKTVVLEGTTCPVCGKGKLRESAMAFSCSEDGCKCQQ